MEIVETVAGAQEGDRVRVILDDGTVLTLRHTIKKGPAWVIEGDSHPSRYLVQKEMPITLGHPLHIEDDDPMTSGIVASIELLSLPSTPTFP